MATRPPSHPQALADGRYVLARKVAEGGTAMVFLGFDTWTDQWRAVKTLLPEYAKRPALRHRFEREAVTMKQLSHDNIIAVYDAGTEDDTVYMVMEYAEGGCIIEWVERHGPMPPRMATRCVLELCAGIDAAHRRDIVHRDIKPQNLLVDRAGVCKVTDFGIAQVVLEETRMTMTGTVMGTIGYMAPEQHESAKHADERADIYSIAATFYTLIRGEAATHLFMAQDEDYDGIPEPLAAVIRRGAQYRRELRYVTVADLASDLEAALRHIEPNPLDTPPLVAADMPILDDLTPPSLPEHSRSSSSDPPLPSPETPGGTPLRSAKIEDATGSSGYPDPSSYDTSASGPSTQDGPGGLMLRPPDQVPEVRAPIVDGLEPVDRSTLSKGTTPRSLGVRPSRRIRDWTHIRHGAAIGGAVFGALSLMALLLAGLYDSWILEFHEKQLAEATENLHNQFSASVLGYVQPTMVTVAGNHRPLEGHEEVQDLIAQFLELDEDQLEDRALLTRRIQQLIEDQVLRDLQRRKSQTAGGDLEAAYKTIQSANEALVRAFKQVDAAQSRLDRERRTPGGRVAGFFFGD